MSNSLVGGSLLVNGYTVLNAPAADSLQLYATVPAASHPALVLDTVNALSGSDKLFSLKVQGVEKAYIDANGNFSGTVSGALVLAAVGSAPNANGMTLVSTTLNLQPADATHPGVVTTGTQTFAGAKTFSGGITASVTGNVTGNASGSAGALAITSGTNATPGSSGTLNTAAGTVVLDHTSGAVYTLTNSLIVAGAHVVAWLETNDATGKGLQSTVLNTSAHTAVFTLQAAPAANVTIAFHLVTFA